MHGLLVVQLNKEHDDLMLIQCTCGEIAAPVVGEHWRVSLNGDGTANVQPSIDFPEHFHQTYDRAPVGKVDLDLEERTHMSAEVPPTAPTAPPEEKQPEKQKDTVKDPEVKTEVKPAEKPAKAPKPKKPEPPHAVQEGDKLVTNHDGSVTVTAFRGETSREVDPNTAPCQTCIDFKGGFRPDRPCGHDD